MKTPEEIKQEAKKFLIDDPMDNYVLDIHEKMFTKPIDTVFIWIEDDYSGEGFVVYQFGDNYLFKSFGFGSCNGCEFAVTSTFLDCFNDVLVSQELSMNMLEVAFSKDQHFLNPDLVKFFKHFLEIKILS